MTNGIKLENLSKEELIKLLKTANARATLFEQEATKAQKKNAKLIESYEKKLTASREKTATYKKKAEDYEIRLNNIAALNKERMEMMNEICKRIQRDYVIFDIPNLKTIEEQLDAVYKELGEWILNASLYRHLLFGKGNDLSHGSGSSATAEKDGPATEGEGNNEGGSDAGKNSDEPQSEQAKIIATSLSVMNRLDRVHKDFFKVVKSLKADEIGACGGEVKDISDTEVPGEDEPEKKPSPGRQKKDRQPKRSERERSKLKDSDLICPHCHKPYAKTKHELEHRMITTKHDMLEIFEYIETHQPFVMCEGCGHVHVILNENEDVPIQPDSEVGIDLMLMAVDAYFHGVPIDRISKKLQAEFGIGHSTIPQSVHVFIRNFLYHLHVEFLSHVMEAPYLVVDGTPFTVLENQGRGNCMNKKEDKKQNGNAPEPEEVVNGKSNYVFAASSVPMADKQFAWYGFLPTRSCKSIEKIFTTDFKAHTIICDAFSGYGTLATERGLKVQNCLVHFRRRIIQTLEPKELADQLLEMPDEQRLEYIKGLHNKGDDTMLLYWAFEALSKIYSLERTVDVTAPDALEQIKKVREKERKLMQDLDGIMAEMVNRHMKVKKNGKMQKDRGDVFSNVATYWYNNHDCFTTFLDDPMVPPDSNRVEQAIRSITILRKNSYHMTSQQGISDLCIVYTVFESLRRIGIKNPAAFIRPFCRDLYNYCVDEWYTQKLYEDGIDGLGKHNVSWNMRKLAKNFDFKGYFQQMFKDYPKF